MLEAWWGGRKLSRRQNRFNIDKYAFNAYNFCINYISCKGVIDEATGFNKAP